MGYHSADYNQDFRIDLNELSRVGAIYNTTSATSGIKTGCYLVDPSTIDGFGVDTGREIDQKVTLTKYHSADYNRDGRIDEAELARVTALYNGRYTDVTLSGTVQDGRYFSGCPGTLDGFGYGSVYLSNYDFDVNHLPTIHTNWVPDLSSNYILRAKFLDIPGQGFHAATTINNNGFSLDTIPGPGVYRVSLYWVAYAKNGFEGDWNNDGLVTTADTDAIAEIASGLLPQPTGSQYVRCDCKPIATKGSGGLIGVGDWVQAGRYRVGLDPYQEAGGPGMFDTPTEYKTWFVGQEQIVYVNISPAPSTCTEPSTTCVCGDPAPIVNEDKGKCFPVSTKRNCNAPTRPTAPCGDNEYQTIYDPNSTPKFKVLAKLMDSSCSPITDEDGSPILTTVV